MANESEVCPRSRLAILPAQHRSAVLIARTESVGPVLSSGGGHLAVTPRRFTVAGGDSPTAEAAVNDGEEVIRARIEAIDERGMSRWSALFGQAHRGEWRFPTLVAGDLVTDLVAFSAADGSGRTKKKRPCLVMEVSDTEIRIRPIHSTGGSLHRTGGGLKLVDWKQANLTNNSVVAAVDEYRFVDGPVNPARRIGRLSDRDFERVFGAPRRESV